MLCSLERVCKIGRYVGTVSLLLSNYLSTTYQVLAMQYTAYLRLYAKYTRSSTLADPTGSRDAGRVIRFIRTQCTCVRVGVRRRDTATRLRGGPLGRWRSASVDCDPRNEPTHARPHPARVLIVTVKRDSGACAPRGLERAGGARPAVAVFHGDQLRASGRAAARCSAVWSACRTRQ